MIRRPNDRDKAPPGPSKWTTAHLDQLVETVTAAVTELRAYCDSLLAELQQSRRQVIEWQCSAELAWNDHCRLLNAYGEGRDIVHARIRQRIVEGSAPIGEGEMDATEAAEFRRLEAERAEIEARSKDPRD